MVKCSNCGWDNPEGLRCCEKCNAPLTFDVFISYSRKDYVDEHENVIPNNEVSKIMKTLTDAGITYWIDKEGIFSGEKFTEELPKIIKSVPIFVYLSTANANKSKYTSKEIAIADEYGKYIIPVRIDMTPYSDKVIFRIADVSFIKYAVNPTKGREDLVKSIKAFLKKKKENELQKKEEERQREEELDRQRKQQEDEKKRQEEIGRIETELSAFESQKVEREKIVLQKEQELKLAQIDLKACEAKIQKLQAKLDGLRNSRANEANGKNNANESPVSESKSNQTTSKDISSKGKSGSDYKVVLRTVGPNCSEVKKCIQKGTKITADEADYFVSKVPIDLFGSYSLAEANKIREALISLGASAAVRAYNT